MLLAAASCTEAPSTSSYVFNPDASPVKVDTPALRAQKAAAGIDDCPVTTPREEPARDNGLPDITLPCLGGGRDVHLDGLTGTPAVVNFWAQTCAPCRKESPILQRLHAAAGDRVRVLGIDWQDSQPDQALAFVEYLGLTYPQLADPDAATRGPLQIAGLPLSLFVDAEGTIVHAEYGAITSLQSLSSLVARHLGVRVGPSDAR
jgi:thiol-disulfide isomerase/thioredoxin